MCACVHKSIRARAHMCTCTHTYVHARAQVTIKRTGVTKPGQIIKIKGEGMPKHGTPSEFGDLTITFTVDFPQQVRTPRIVA